MKAHIWSIKLAMAIGLLLASVALAGPNADDSAKGSSPAAKPSEGGGVLKSDDGTVIELGPDEPGPVQSLRPEVRIHSGNPVPPPSDDKSLLVDVPRPRAMLGEYWIGVRCGPLPPPLREHLGLSDDRGLYVLEVVPGAPAAKAGVKPADILLAANDAPLVSAVDLIRVVDQAKDQPLVVDVLHNGTKKQVEIKPEKNPHGGPQDAQPGLKSPPYDELDRIYEWFDRQFPGRGARPQMRLRFMHPGTILPPDAPMHPALPGTMSITIMKQGDQPTQITVTRDKETWKVDEKSIDQLPADVRPHVERMLQGMVIGPEAMGPRLDYLPDWAAPRAPGGQPRPGPSLRDRIEERIDRMNQQLQELQERIESLRDTKGPEETK